MTSLRASAWEANGGGERSRFFVLPRPLKLPIPSQIFDVNAYTWKYKPAGYLDSSWRSIHASPCSAYTVSLYITEIAAFLGVSSGENGKGRHEALRNVSQDWLRKLYTRTLALKQ